MTQLEALWKYQQAEMNLDKLTRELKNTPARQKRHKLRIYLQDQTDKISAFQGEITEKSTIAKGFSDKLASLLKEYDLEQDELKIMLEDDECTAEELKEAREALEGLNDKVAALKKNLSETAAWIEKTLEDINSTYASAGKAKKEYDSIKAVCDAEEAETKPRINAAKREVECAALQLDPLLLKKYRAVKKNHAQPMAKVENDQCGGCNMSLPTVVIRRVQAGNGIVECENCGRILCIL